MTQFIVFSGPEPYLSKHTDLHAVSLAEDVISEYVEGVLSESLTNESWVLRGREGEPGHDLCNDAMIIAQECGSIKHSELGEILVQYLPNAKAITFFYGTDTDALLKFYKESDLLEYLAQCLSGKSDNPWEIYAIYRAES